MLKLDSSIKLYISGVLKHFVSMIFYQDDDVM